MAALHVVREAVADAGWGASELCDAALVLGTSRGNAAGWLSPWPGRRPFKVMSASNSIHSEPAAAISIEFGITGPSQVLAGGCAAGLDAIGVAMMMLRAGLADRAIAVAVDLPLVPMLLDSYAASGILSGASRLDPFHPDSVGFLPGEGAAAMAICPGGEGAVALCHYGTNSDAADPVGIPSDGGMTSRLFAAVPAGLLPLAAVCPHATGTAVQRRADPCILSRIPGEFRPSLHLLKPYVGHTVGASGLLESVLLASFMRQGFLPPNPAWITAPSGWDAPLYEVPALGAVGKLSHGMGGRNSLLVISP